MAMNLRSRRSLLAVLTAGVLLLGGCALVPAPAASAVAPELRAVLAPTGVLRVGVYPGSPSSLVVDGKTGNKTGIAHDLGRQLAADIGVPAEIVEFSRIAEVIDAVKLGRVDFTFTNATPARAKDVDFTSPLVKLELGYLVPNGSTISDVSRIDRAGVRVGVTEGSSSYAVLSKQYQNAKLATAPSLKVAVEMLSKGQIDAYATNKAILFELADQLPGSQVLNGRWGEENLAIAVPQGRSAAAAYLRQFARRVSDNGQLDMLISRSGLRGTMKSQ